MIEIELRQGPHRLFECFTVDRRPAAEAREELGELEAIDHRGYVLAAYRKEPQRGVARKLHQNAAGADEYERPIERIGARANDRLDARDHLLHQEAVDAGARMERACGRYQCI